MEKKFQLWIVNTEAGKLEIAHEHFDLRSIVQEILLEPKRAFHSITFGTLRDGAYEIWKSGDHLPQSLLCAAANEISRQREERRAENLRDLDSECEVNEKYGDTY